MKILWFTYGIPIDLDVLDIKKKYSGRDWISQLAFELIKDESIELSIAYVNYKNDTIPVIKKHQNLTLIEISPITIIQYRINKIFFNKSNIKTFLSHYQYIISTIKPDIIQLFGVEHNYGMICEFTNIPVSIHLQGFTTECLPIWKNKLSITQMLRYDCLKLLIGNSYLNQFFLFYERAQIEEKILKNGKYFLGRTHWDRQIVEKHSSKHKYFRCEEILRPMFYINEWKMVESNENEIISILNPDPYKGWDLILKTAKILNQSHGEIVWKIAGVDQADRIIKIFERITKIKAADVNIKFLGKLNEQELTAEMKKSAFFVHPSHIDNSSNSVCEAMMLGMPVITTNVGGLSSIVTHTHNGILVEANNPQLLANEISKMCSLKETAENLGIQARRTALLRHNKEGIVQNLKTVYHAICK